MAEAGKAYQSCLIPYENEIVSLRRQKRPVPYSQIAEYLKEKYNITVRRQTIEKFLKVRARGFRRCKYAWAIEIENAESQTAIETPPLQKKTVSETPKSRVFDNNKSCSLDMLCSETYSLPPEDTTERHEKENMNNEPENTRQVETNRAFEYPIPLPAGVHEDNVLQQIQNIIAKNGRFDYLSIYDIPIISRYFFDKIKELGCKRDGENRSYCTDPAVVLKIVKAVHTLDEEKGKKFLSKIEAG